MHALLGQLARRDPANAGVGAGDQRNALPCGLVLNSCHAWILSNVIESRTRHREAPAAIVITSVAWRSMASGVMDCITSFAMTSEVRFSHALQQTQHLLAIGLQLLDAKAADALQIFQRLRRILRDGGQRGIVKDHVGRQIVFFRHFAAPCL